MDYRACIDLVTAYIHNHINDELELEKLAGLAGFSPFHFHRIFAAVMGETVAEYVRRLRLSMAVQRLLQSHASVTEIALAIGYETPAAFTKAFRKRFGVAPMTLRTMDRAAAYALLLNQPAVKKGTAHMITPEIRILPDLRVLYARGYGIIDYQYHRAASAAFTTLMGFVRQHDLMDKFSARLGLTPDDYNTIPHDQCRFDAGVVLQEGVDVQPEGGISLQVLAGGRWAVFEHKGTYDTLWQSWNTAYRDWLVRSGETLRDAPPMEIYVNNIKDTPVDKLRTEILIPIQ